MQSLDAHGKHIFSSLLAYGFFFVSVVHTALTEALNVHTNMLTLSHLLSLSLPSIHQIHAG